MTTSWEAFNVTGVPQVAAPGAVEYPVLHLVKGVHSVHRIGQRDTLVVLAEPIEEEDGQALLALLRSLPGVEGVEPIESTASSKLEPSKVQGAFMEALSGWERDNVPTEASAMQAVRYRTADRISKRVFAAVLELL